VRNLTDQAAEAVRAFVQAHRRRGAGAGKIIVWTKKRRRWVAVVASVLFFVALTAVVLHLYKGSLYWPALVTEFGASLGAFMLALEWERHRDLRALERAQKERIEARQTEAQKRLHALKKELERNKTSLQHLAGGLDSPHASKSIFMLLHPELLDASWAASSARLGDLLADYELVATLAAFYGRLEELRWRIRYRTRARDTHLDGMTLPLVAEMQEEVANLLSRVEKEADAPKVQVIGVAHVLTLGTVMQASAALSVDAKKVEA